MSTLEKFGILVILILVVIIGVVAVWGVRPDEANPFEGGDGSATAAVDPATADPAAQTPAWPDGGAAAPAPANAATGPVAPPALGSEPSPASAGGAAPPAAASGGSTYTVKKGDTLERIAKETLGDGTRWQEIVKANPGLSPKRLKIGQTIAIPGGGGVSVASSDSMPVPAPNSLAPRTTAPVPAANPADGPTEPARTAPAPREVEVRSGDTLYGIAQRELGDANLYYKIVKANPGLDPKRLRPGMKVKLPTE